MKMMTIYPTQQQDIYYMVEHEEEDMDDSKTIMNIKRWKKDGVKG